jgi:DNA replication protein DnaC
VLGEVCGVVITSPVCDACAQAARAESDRIVAESRARSQRELLIERGLLPPESRVATFERAGQVDARDQRHYAAMDAATRQDGRLQRNLFLFGRKGAGKSFLGLCLLNRGMAAGLSVAQFSGHRVIQDATKDRRHTRTAGTVGLLLLDDVHLVSFPWRSCLAELHDLFDARAKASLRTILTCQYPATPGSARAGKYPTTWAQCMAAETGGETLAVGAILDRLKPLELEFLGESMR